jgi:hypothetical protein
MRRAVLYLRVSTIDQTTANQGALPHLTRRFETFFTADNLNSSKRSTLVLMPAFCPTSTAARAVQARSGGDPGRRCWRAGGKRGSGSTANAMGGFPAHQISHIRR